MPIRAVLDTNILVSGLLAQFGASHAIVERLRAGVFVAIVSDELVAEYQRVITRPFLAKRSGYTPEELHAYVDGIIRVGEFISIVTAAPIQIRDVKDNHVLAAAFVGEADYLVTGDDDLLTLDGEPVIGALRILKPRAFLSLLTGEANSEPPR